MKATHTPTSKKKQTTVKQNSLSKTNAKVPRFKNGIVYCKQIQTTPDISNIPKVVFDCLIVTSQGYPEFAHLDKECWDGNVAPR